MVKHLENLLYEKTKDSQSAILYAQWNYDKKIIPSALNSVANLFPHYSLHDESHSITIINNIVRVIGKENIAKLSAIDIWLILEAAYNHDLGMVVSSAELVRTLNSEKFIDFFKELLQDNKNGLHEFAVQFEINEGKIKQKNTLLNLELNDAIKYILAEFFRRTHAERSGGIVNNPLFELGIESPRGVIPARIYKILANICSCHTKSFDDVMRLPFSEVGIDIEDAHPKFIACLLRVGDLLDLDNNRFSEVMLKTLTKIPIDTLNHKAKHLSIESFRVDKDKIEITANCQDYEVANITQHWFNYINSEISSQMLNWNDIVPFKELGYLPTIGSLKVELANYELIDGKNRPKFSVDTDKALELLQGSGIYDGAYKCIREILQNATDATLIRIWLENKDNKEIDLSSPKSEDFKKLVKAFPITIEIIEKGIKDGKQNWQIIIEDRGTGLSNNDLRYLMNTGSSSKNIEKTKIIAEMPIWMRPSGIFGIGFQSIFMLTDSVQIETKSFHDELFQTIELNSPNSKKDGSILIQKKKTNFGIKPGTKLSIHFSIDAIPNRYSINSGQTNALRIADNFDPFSNDSLDIEIGKIADEVFFFAEKNYMPTILKVDGKLIDTHQSLELFKFFDIDTSLELNITTDINKLRCITYYKNQHVSNNLDINFINIEVNIHKDKASQVLTIDRNKIKNDYSNQLKSEIVEASFRIITSNFDEIFQTEYSKYLGSMFLNYYSNEQIIEKFNIKNFNHWENSQIQIGNEIMKMIDLINNTNTLILIYDNKITSNIDDIYSLHNGELTLRINGVKPSRMFTEFFLFKIKEVLTNIVSSRNIEPNVKENIFTKLNYTATTLSNDILRILKNIKKGNSHSARTIIPCTEKFLSLRIKDTASYSYVYPYYFDSNVYLTLPKMLCPYIFYKDINNKNYLKKVVNSKVIDWVFENRYDRKTSKEDIIKSYDDFCNTINLDEINKIVEGNEIEDYE